MREIPLTQGRVALVDDADYDYLNQWKWFADNEYACRNFTISRGVKKKVRMHRLLMGHIHKEQQIDHIDGNGFNNQRGNLRLVTVSQNHCNARTPTRSKSGVKGVFWDAHGKKWRAHIGYNYDTIFLGSHSTIEEATQARKEAEKIYHGEYARS